MESVQNVVSNFNGRAIKEPRGFMKILQFLFTICAFATTTSYLSYLKLNVECDSGAAETVNVPLQYSFQLYKLELSACAENGSTKSLSFRQDFSSDSCFFVAVGVLAFLFSVGALCFYTLYDKIYSQDARIPNIDFGIHCIFAVLFLACSSAWANGLNGLKSATSLNTIVEENPDTCSFNMCSVLEEPSFSKLNISVLLGFLNVFLFTSNLWFIYKETTCFVGKEPDKAAANEHPGP